MKKAPIVFGAADGLTIITGLVAGMAVSHQPSKAVWAAALSGGLAELVGMTSGQYQSDSASGWPTALACGVASAGACIVPAVPWLLPLGRAWAVLCTVVLVAGVCAVVAWLRPEKGARAVIETYTLTIAAGVLTAAVALLGA